MTSQENSSAALDSNGRPAWLRRAARLAAVMAACVPCAALANGVVSFSPAFTTYHPAPVFHPAPVINAPAAVRPMPAVRPTGFAAPVFAPRPAYAPRPAAAASWSGVRPGFAYSGHHGHWGANGVWIVDAAAEAVAVTAATAYNPPHWVAPHWALVPGHWEQ